MKLIFLDSLVLRWYCVYGAWREYGRAKSILNWCFMLSPKARDLGVAQESFVYIPFQNKSSDWHTSCCRIKLSHHRFYSLSQSSPTYPPVMCNILLGPDKYWQTLFHYSLGNYILHDSQKSQVNHLTVSLSTRNINCIYYLYYVIQFYYTHLLPEILFSWISKWMCENKAVTQLFLGLL